MSDITEAEFARRKAIESDFDSRWDFERKIQREAEGSFNKGLFTAAAGSFGVSFAFINQVVPVIKANMPQFLIASWALMGLTLVLCLIEHLATYFVQDKLLDNIDANVQRGFDGKPYMTASKMSVMLPDRLVKCLTLASFLAGIICLLLFVSQNVSL